MQASKPECKRNGYDIPIATPRQPANKPKGILREDVEAGVGGEGADEGVVNLVHALRHGVVGGVALLEPDGDRVQQFRVVCEQRSDGRNWFGPKEFHSHPPQLTTTNKNHPSVAPPPPTPQIISKNEPAKS